MLWGNRKFNGTFPRTDDRMLPEFAAQVAENCWLDRGYPRPVPALRLVNGSGGAVAAADAVEFDPAVKTIFRFDATRWFEWDTDVDAVRAPIFGDSVLRTVWTGAGRPRHTATTIMQGGGFVSPGTPISRRLGVPAPDDTPTATAGAYTDEDDTAIAEHHAWVYTFLTDLDEEGPPSSPSDVIERGFNADGTILPVTLSDLPTAPPADWSANRKRLYRTATGTTGVTTYQLLATIDITAATYTDETLTGNLAEGLISSTWDPPPEDLAGLIALPNGVLAGFVDRDVWFSEPYQPHAWPADYTQAVDSDIVGLGNFGVNVLVGTRGKPYLISGSHPQQVATSRMEFAQVCAAKNSFASVDQQGVVFASAEGLVLVGPGGGQFISRKFYDRADWQALNPGQIRGVYHDGAYIAFTDDKATAINPAMEGTVEVVDAGVEAVFQDTERDRVYVIDSQHRLAEWKTEPAAGDSARTLKWRSGIQVGKKRTYYAAQVIADDYPVTFKLFGDGDELMSKAVADGSPFRLPKKNPGDGDAVEHVGLHSEWEYEVSGDQAIREVRIGAMEDMLDE